MVTYLSNLANISLLNLTSASINVSNSTSINLPETLLALSIAVGLSLRLFIEIIQEEKRKGAKNKTQ